MIIIFYSVKQNKKLQMNLHFLLHVRKKNYVLSIKNVMTEIVLTFNRKKVDFRILISVGNNKNKKIMKNIRENRKKNSEKIFWTNFPFMDLVI